MMAELQDTCWQCEGVPQQNPQAEDTSAPVQLGQDLNGLLHAEAGDGVLVDIAAAGARRCISGRPGFHGDGNLDQVGLQQVEQQIDQVWPQLWKVHGR